METLIAVDPGKQTGIAVFKNRKLATCVLLDCSDHHLLHGQHWYFWVGACVVCEIPQSYRGSAVSPQSLMTLAFDAGYVVGSLRPKEVVLVKPREWKGQTPKKIDHERTRRLLSNAERFVLEKGLRDMRPSYRHNVMDAVGIGLWKLRRRK